jgi:hypothetical protein
MATAGPARVAQPARRPRWRLRALLVLDAVLIGLYFHNEINPPTPPGMLSTAGRRLKDEALALGGRASLVERTDGFLGIFGRTESFHIDVHGRDIGDAGLARLVAHHGGRIRGLDLRNTGVSDDGLRCLEGLSHLRQLALGNDDRGLPRIDGPLNRVTDAGLVHLKGLDQLMYLQLAGLPVTDAGLEALEDLPDLGHLDLGRTRVAGRGLRRLKSLPRLGSLDLGRSEITNEGLGHLAGASSLQSLLLAGMPLRAEGLERLKAMPRLLYLDITDCGLTDEEVGEIRKARPAIRIERR